MPRPRKTTRRRTTRARRQKRILNCKPSPKTEDDWTYDDAARADVATAASASIPSSKDLRASWWTIADQGSTGSCVGWASADSLLRWHFVKAGKLTTSQPLSPRFMWMASKETDPIVTRPTTFIETEGTSLKTALDVARKFGVVRDSYLPFASGKLYAGQAKTFYATAALRKILAYFNLGTNLSNWRAWLANNGPIMVRLDVDSTWDDASFTGGNLDEYKPASTRGGHAVALVGYTADRFIVRNSWGTGWGDKGFAYASLAYAQEAFTEAYGVEV
jgi:hypothetical protein